VLQILVVYSTNAPEISSSRGEEPYNDYVDINTTVH